MNIILDFSHQTRIELLTRLDHEFYVPEGYEHIFNNYLEEYMAYFPKELPNNLHPDKTCEQPDIKIASNKGTGDIQFFQSSWQELQPNCFTAYRSQTMLVEHPPKNDKWFWLGRGVDTDRFQGWKGGSNIITSGNCISTRPIFNQEALETLKQEFGDRFKVYGYKKNYMAGDSDFKISKFYTKDFLPVRELAEKLRTCAVYVNLGVSPGPNCLLEAMSTGCPVVSVKSKCIGDFITHKYNGLITDNVVKGVSYLLDHKNKAKQFGERARQKCLGEYNINEWLKRWEQSFQLVKERKDNESSM